MCPFLETLRVQKCPNLRGGKHFPITLNIFPKLKVWSCFFDITSLNGAKPHCSVSSVADLRTRGRWFNPQLGQYSLPELIIVISLSVLCFDNGYVGKHPVAWKKYSAEYWLKKTPGKHG